MPLHLRLRLPATACVVLVLTATVRLFAQNATPAPAGPPPPAPAPETAAAPAAAAPGEELVGPVQMRGETLEAVLVQLGRLTGRSIIRPQALPATEGYTISLPVMPKSEVVLALETMLSLSGIAVAPLGDKFLKVVPVGQARTEAPEMIEGSTLDLAPSGRIATKLFPLVFLRVSEFKDQVTPLLNPNLGGPVVFDKTNAVLITDSISTLQRIEMLIREIDRPAAALQPKFYSLHFAKASDLVTRIMGILKPPLSLHVSSATSLSADDRTNQIVLISDPRQYPFFDELIEKLDVKSDPNTRNEVIYLKHATAKDVATLLTNLVSGQNQAASRADQSAPRAAPAAAGPASATPPARPANVPAALQPVIAGALGESGPTSQFSGLVTVLADDRSNSIVVSGTVDDLRLIKEIVAKVDVLLAQVSIQVVIAEITLSDSDTSGINALSLTVGQNAKGATAITQFSASTSSGANGIAGWNITGGVVTPLAFQAAMGTTGAKSNVRVLSSNTIVTTHNKQAEFVVSQQQPIITGSTTTPTATTSGLVSSSTVTYKDIGIDVKVTPLIGDDGSIQMEIDQKVDDVVGNVQVDANTQPIIGHREATSFVNVGDGQIIVLGGLQQTKHSTDRNKLGFLFQIPIISQLLGGRNHSETRTELLLFVRPHIIPPGGTTQDATASIDQLTNGNQVRQFIENPSQQPKDSGVKQPAQ